MPMLIEQRQQRDHGPSSKNDSSRANTAQFKAFGDAAVVLDGTIMPVHLQGILKLETDMEAIQTKLSQLGTSLTTELLVRLDIEEYLDELDRALPLKTGQRIQFAELLRAADLSIEATPFAAPGSQPLAKLILPRHVGTAARLSKMDQAIGRQQRSGLPVDKKYALGNILVASDQITRAQLEDALRRQLASGRRVGEELIDAGHVSEHQVAHGLFLQRVLIPSTLAVAIGLAPMVGIGPQAHAGQTNAVMPVSATVVAHAKLLSSYQVEQLVITEADVSRGYVHANAASRFAVVTNSRAGYLMEFHPMGHLFESVRIEGLGNPVLMGADGGIVVQRALPSAELLHELNFRFDLGRDAQPGRHVWPLRMVVRPL